jgi:putative CocE/NonD family hydrolase
MPSHALAPALLLFSVVPFLQAADAFDVPSHYSKLEVRIAMRDGVRLFTSIYVPRDASVKYPILLTRTPYGVDPYGPDKYPKQLGPSPAFDRDGFIFVFQDVRGRYMSEGVWREMTPERRDSGTADAVDESTDAYDTIDWLVKNLPANNGKVGLLGISYPGFYASAGMIHAHPALVAASPQAPVSDLYMGDDAYHNGAFFLAANFGFYVDFPKQANPMLPSNSKPFSFGTKDGYKFYLRMGALTNAQNYFHSQNPYWDDAVSHTTYDEFWRIRDILPHLRDVKPAVLVVGGWFDAEDLSGTLKTYRALRAQSPSTDEHLVMGPWVHGGWEDPPGDSLGAISFGSKTSVFFQDTIALPFFRHYLKGAPDPDLPAAYVFETGENEWHKESSWPPPRVTGKRLFLHGGGQLSFDRPQLSSEPYDEYVSDPNHPVPYFPNKTTEMARQYMDADQRFVSRRPDVLSYQTAPLQDDVVVAGPISPSLFVSTSGTDSDFVVKLIDVYPESGQEKLNGYRELVRGEPFRGKFRDSFETPRAFPPNSVQQIRFDMPDVFHRFRKGHRIMIQIQSSWFPLVDRNPQTFTDIPTAAAAAFQKATERVFHSPESASFVRIPVESE